MTRKIKHKLRKPYANFFKQLVNFLFHILALKVGEFLINNMKNIIVQ